MAVDGGESTGEFSLWCRDNPMEGRNAQKLVSGKTNKASIASYIC